MKGKIIVNGYYFGENERYRCERLLDEFEKKNVVVELEKNNRPHSIDEKFDFDFALFFDKDIHYAALLEKNGIRLFNTSSVLEKTDSKIKTALSLSKIDGIDMPKTIFAPKKFRYVQDKDFLQKVGEKLGFPLVVKEAYGSLGQQVYLANDKEELFLIDEKIGEKDSLYQSYQRKSRGTSVRIICIGQQVVGGIKLHSEGDFRSNAHLGGIAEKFDIPQAYKEKAELVAKSLGADYCGIDFFYDSPTLIEVNGSAYFTSFEKITGINVAKKYVEYILGEITVH